MILHKDRCCSLLRIAANTEADDFAGPIQEEGLQAQSVSVRSLHLTHPLTGFSSFQVHGSSESRRLTGCPSTIRVSTSRR
jgi:hypothetical protein